MVYAVYIVTQFLFLILPLPRFCGGPYSDRRLTIFWAWQVFSNAIGLAVNIAWGNTIQAAFSALWLAISVFFLWTYLRHTRRGKRATKAIGAKAKAIRDSLVRTQREAERRLRPQLPPALPA